MTEITRNQWKAWLKAAGIRAIRTFAQAAVACMPVTMATLGDVEWVVVFSTATVAAIFSLLTSLAGIPEADCPLVAGDDE